MPFSELTRDYHIHTNFSDGYVTPESMIQGAIDKEVDQICITDHYSYSKPALRHEDLEQYFNTLQELKKAYAQEVKVFIGIEVDVSSIDSFDYLLSFSWDLVLFEYVFSIPDWEQAFRDVLKFKKRVPEMKVGLAHTRFSRLTLTKFDYVMTNIHENEIIVELNSSYMNFKDPYFNYLDDTNIYSVGSDAHSQTQLGEVSGALSFLHHRNISQKRIIQL